MFCLYRINPVLSLDESVEDKDTMVTDFYFPLGDILLFKDYRKYQENYHDMLNKYNSNRTVSVCESPQNNSSSSNNSMAPAAPINNEGFIGEVSGAPGIIPRGDVHITNYDQPGLKGLQVLVKMAENLLALKASQLLLLMGIMGRICISGDLYPEGYILWEI